MLRRGGVALILVVPPLVFAAVSSASGGPQVTAARGPITSLTRSELTVQVTAARGPITSLTRWELTVQANAEVPTSCTRTSASPGVGGFALGDTVVIACVKSVLTQISSGVVHSSLGPVIPITGLAEAWRGLPAPGRAPTPAQCAAAWNANAPLAARNAIGALTPLGADIAIEEMVSQQNVTGPGCRIEFALPGPIAKTAQVTAVWNHDTAKVWTGFATNDSGQQLVAAAALSTGQTGYSVSATGTLSER